LSDQGAQGLNRRLVADLRRKGAIRSAEVRRAFLDVLRHHFLPDEPLELVYSDQAIVTKTRDGMPISSSSQPAVMAVMLEQLQLRPGMRVLEIGAGTGYNAALMASLVGGEGHVTSLDIDEDIVQAAVAHLAAAGVEGVAVVRVDGVQGWPAGAPYDRVILTVGSPDVFPAWVGQLSRDGRLLLPLGIGAGVQRSVVFRRANGHLESVSVAPCGFMTLRGEAETRTPEASTVILEPGVRFAAGGDAAVDADRVRAWLAAPFRSEESAVAVSESAAWGSLQLWLSMNEPGFCLLTAAGAAAEREELPDLLAGPGHRGSYGLIGDRGLCLLTRVSPGRAGVAVRTYGADPALARRLMRRLVEWDAAGRPCGEGLRISAFPRADQPRLRPGQVLVRKSLHSFVLDCD
jgi:protein-L-isoaspartate(D-aspartate) O-methyltransferase